MADESCRSIVARSSLLTVQIAEQARLELREPLLLEGVEDEPALAPSADGAGLGEHAEVPGQGGLADPDERGELSGRSRLLGDEAEDAEAGVVAERAQEPLEVCRRQRLDFALGEKRRRIDDRLRPGTVIEGGHEIGPGIDAGDEHEPFLARQLPCAVGERRNLDLPPLRITT